MILSSSVRMSGVERDGDAVVGPLTTAKGARGQPRTALQVKRVQS